MASNSAATPDKLVAAALRAWALPPADTKTLAGDIYAGRVAALQAAYEAAAAVAGVDLPDGGYEAPDSVLEEQAQAALAAAQGVAATYRSNLEGEARRFVAQWGSAHQQEYTGCGAALAQVLATWSAARGQWKAQQIALAETGAGADAGTRLLLADLAAGTVTPGDGGDGESGRPLVVAVLPADAARADICAVYAGNLYAVDDAENLPEFPAHVGCDHYLALVDQAGDETDSTG